MTKREKAIELMNELRRSGPRPIFERIDNSDKGIYFILGYLRHHQNEDVYAIDLAKKLHVSTARISVVLKKLENRGLILKQQDKNDTRRVKIKLSKKGERLAIEHFEKIIKAHEKLVDEISDAELKTYIRISKKIKEALCQIDNKEGDNNENI